MDKILNEMGVKKLKIYNRDNTYSYGNKASVNMTKKGVVIFNHKAQTLLDLKAGDGVVFAQDPDRPADWYVRKSIGSGSEFKLRGLGSQTRSMGFNCKDLVMNIINSVSPDKDRLSIRIGTPSDDEAFHPLITAPLITKK